MGDFNCKEMHWEDMATEGDEDSWGYMLLELTMEYTMTQWIHENTRFRNSEEPSRLDFLFTTEPEIVDGVEYKTPLAKSDHVLIVATFKEVIGKEWNEKIEKED
ncbi:hypothetical protein E2C01_063613 [Portunus trituberculatus]|uniref:Endonuclease/exonuclease/phosphatase domain-containing protein n=1 Tax=Portunus trituberculatus TaxID=210409 RepID=A0A5B7HAX3_PORTR|nr:hypothetical protein [Portunus trituberculatus]